MQGARAMKNEVYFHIITSYRHPPLNPLPSREGKHRYQAPTEDEIFNNNRYPLSPQGRGNTGIKLLLKMRSSTIIDTPSPLVGEGWGEGSFEKA